MLDIYQKLCEKYKEGVEALSGDADQLEKLLRCAKLKGIVGYIEMDKLLTKFNAQNQKDVFHNQLPEKEENELWDIYKEKRQYSLEMKQLLMEHQSVKGFDMLGSSWANLHMEQNALCNFMSVFHDVSYNSYLKGLENHMNAVVNFTMKNALQAQYEEAKKLTKNIDAVWVDGAIMLWNRNYV